MKKNSDTERRVECTPVRESENPRPLKAGSIGSDLKRCWRWYKSGDLYQYQHVSDVCSFNFFALLMRQETRKCWYKSGDLYQRQRLSSQALAKCHINKLLLLLGLSSLLSACLSKKDYTEEEIQALMDAELQRKIATYRKSKMDACQEEAFRQATKIVDSLVIAEAYFDRDTFARPPKPIKPDEKAPEIKGPDTIQLKPLFEGKRKKVKVDTLLKKTKKDTILRKKN